MTILITTNSLIFIFLAVLHIYWAIGGKALAEEVTPTRLDGTFLFRPGPISSIIVAIILFGFSLIIFGNSGVFDHLMNRFFFHFGTLSIGAIFLVRAIGDFKYIGFFKRIKGTAFAKKDTNLYSPLCLFVSLISFLIIRGIGN
jgi:hypothetical protein